MNLEILCVENSKSRNHSCLALNEVWLHSAEQVVRHAEEESSCMQPLSFPKQCPVIPLESCCCSLSVLHFRFLNEHKIHFQCCVTSSVEILLQQSRVVFLPSYNFPPSSCERYPPLPSSRAPHRLLYTDLSKEVTFKWAVLSRERLIFTALGCCKHLNINDHHLLGWHFLNPEK